MHAQNALRMENYRFGYLAEFVDPQSYGSRVRVRMGGSCYRQIAQIHWVLKIFNDFCQARPLTP